MSGKYLLTPEEIKKSIKDAWKELTGENLPPEYELSLAIPMLQAQLAKVLRLLSLDDEQMREEVTGILHQYIIWNLDETLIIDESLITDQISALFATLKQEAVKKEREKMIRELEECFSLAPYDDAYLRLLVEDRLAYFKTGKRRKERQALKANKEVGE